MGSSDRRPPRPIVDDADFERICVAASNARNRVWGHHETLSNVAFDRMVELGAHELGLRAAVAATLYAVGIKPPDDLMAQTREADQESTADARPTA